MIKRWPRPAAYVVGRVMAADHLSYTKDSQARNTPLYTKEQVAAMLEAAYVNDATPFWRKK